MSHRRVFEATCAVTAEDTLTVEPATQEDFAGALICVAVTNDAEGDTVSVLLEIDDAEATARALLDLCKLARERVAH